jgi:hypothetical protein
LESLELTRAWVLALWLFAVVVAATFAAFVALKSWGKPRHVLSLGVISIFVMSPYAQLYDYGLLVIPLVSVWPAVGSRYKPALGVCDHLAGTGLASKPRSQFMRVFVLLFCFLLLPYLQAIIMSREWFSGQVTYFWMPLLTAAAVWRDLRFHKNE